MTLKLQTIEQAIDYAIQREQESADMYLNLAKRVADKSLVQALLQFAKEELGHKKKLEFEKILIGKSLHQNQVILDVDPTLFQSSSPTNYIDFTIEDLLFLAVKKEEMAFRVYTELAARTKDPQLKTVLLQLAEEEVRHKIRFEIEYNNTKNHK